MGSISAWTGAQGDYSLDGLHLLFSQLGQGASEATRLPRPFQEEGATGPLPEERLRSRVEEPRSVWEARESLDGMGSQEAGAMCSGSPPLTAQEALEAVEATDSRAGLCMGHFRVSMAPLPGPKGTGGLSTDLIPHRVLLTTTIYGFGPFSSGASPHDQGFGSSFLCSMGSIDCTTQDWALHSHPSSRGVWA